MNTKDRKKLAAGVGTGLLALALIGGGTFAAWTDFDTVEDNRVTAGQLVAVAQDNSVSVGDLAPGETEILTFAVTNRSDSSTNATVSFQLANLRGDELGCSSTNSEKDDDSNCDNGRRDNQGELVEDAVAAAAFNTGPCSDPMGPVVHGNRNLVEFQNAVKGFAPALVPGQTGCVRLLVTLPQGVDNASQGDSASFDMKLNLTQSS